MIRYEYPHFIRDGTIMKPLVFDAGPGEDAPEGFSAIRIALDGGLQSDLQWKQPMEDARKAVAVGLPILWDLDLGLFGRLTLSLSDEMQFRALQRAVRHLLDRIHDQFLGSTLGVVLYRGSLDFSYRFPWTWESRDAAHGLSGRAERSFCRDAAVGYLRQLMAGWPDAVQPVVLLDAGRITSPFEVLCLTHRHLLSGMTLCLHRSPIRGTSLGWECSSPYGSLSRSLLPVIAEEQAVVGICLPSEPLSNEQFMLMEDVIRWFIGENRPFRVVTEEFLTSDWDGLDDLVIPPARLGTQGVRKLLGFCAAGGTVVATGQMRGLPQEITFTDYQQRS